MMTATEQVPFHSIFAQGEEEEKIFSSTGSFMGGDKENNNVKKGGAIVEKIPFSHNMPPPPREQEPGGALLGRKGSFSRSLNSVLDSAGTASCVMTSSGTMNPPLPPSSPIDEEGTCSSSASFTSTSNDEREVRGCSEAKRKAANNSNPRAKFIHHRPHPHQQHVAQSLTSNGCPTTHAEQFVQQLTMDILSKVASTEQDLQMIPPPPPPLHPHNSSGSLRRGHCGSSTNAVLNVDASGPSSLASSTAVPLSPISQSMLNAQSSPCFSQAQNKKKAEDDEKNKTTAGGGDENTPTKKKVNVGSSNVCAGLNYFAHQQMKQMIKTQEEAEEEKTNKEKEKLLLLPEKSKKEGNQQETKEESLSVSSDAASSTILTTPKMSVQLSSSGSFKSSCILSKLSAPHGPCAGSLQIPELARSQQCELYGENGSPLAKKEEQCLLQYKKVLTPLNPRELLAGHNEIIAFQEQPKGAVEEEEEKEEQNFCGNEKKMPTRQKDIGDVESTAASSSDDDGEEEERERPSLDEADHLQFYDDDDDADDECGGMIICEGTGEKAVLLASSTRSSCCSIATTTSCNSSRSSARVKTEQGQEDQGSLEEGKRQKKHKYKKVYYSDMQCKKMKDIEYYRTFRIKPLTPGKKQSTTIHHRKNKLGCIIKNEGEGAEGCGVGPSPARRKRAPRPQIQHLGTTEVPVEHTNTLAPPSTIGISSPSNKNPIDKLSVAAQYQISNILRSSSHQHHLQQHPTPYPFKTIDVVHVHATAPVETNSSSSSHSSYCCFTALSEIPANNSDSPNSTRPSACSTSVTSSRLSSEQSTNTLSKVRESIVTQSTTILSEQTPGEASSGSSYSTSSRCTLKPQEEEEEVDMGHVVLQEPCSEVEKGGSSLSPEVNRDLFGKKKKVTGNEQVDENEVVLALDDLKIEPLRNACHSNDDSDEETNERVGGLLDHPGTGTTSTSTLLGDCLLHHSSREVPKKKELCFVRKSCVTNTPDTEDATFLKRGENMISSSEEAITRNHSQKQHQQKDRTRSGGNNNHMMMKNSFFGAAASPTPLSPNSLSVLRRQHPAEDNEEGDEPSPSIPLSAISPVEACSSARCFSTSTASSCQETRSLSLERHIRETKDTLLFIELEDREASCRFVTTSLYDEMCSALVTQERMERNRKHEEEFLQQHSAAKKYAMDDFASSVVPPQRYCCHPRVDEEESDRQLEHKILNFQKNGLIFSAAAVCSSRMQSSYSSSPDGGGDNNEEVVSDVTSDDDDSSQQEDNDDDDDDKVWRFFTPDKVKEARNKLRKLKKPDEEEETRENEEKEEEVWRFFTPDKVRKDRKFVEKQSKYGQIWKFENIEEDITGPVLLPPTVPGDQKQDHGGCFLKNFEKEGVEKKKKQVVKKKTAEKKNVPDEDSDGDGIWRWFTPDKKKELRRAKEEEQEKIKKERKNKKDEEKRQHHSIFSSKVNINEEGAEERRQYYAFVIQSAQSRFLAEATDFANSCITATDWLIRMCEIGARRFLQLQTIQKMKLQIFSFILREESVRSYHVHYLESHKRYLLNWKWRLTHPILGLIPLRYCQDAEGLVKMEGERRLVLQCRWSAGHPMTTMMMEANDDNVAIENNNRDREGHEKNETPLFPFHHADGEGCWGECSVDQLESRQTIQLVMQHWKQHRLHKKEVEPQPEAPLLLEGGRRR